MAYQPEQSWLAWGHTIRGPINAFVAGSVGHYQGAPWVGPYVSLSTPVAKIGGKDLVLGTFHWPAFFAWQPESKKAAGIKRDPILVGYLGAVSASWGPVTVTQAYQHFLEMPWNSLPGVALTVPLTPDWDVNASVTRNTNKNKAMFYLGGTWTRK